LVQQIYDIVILNLSIMSNELKKYKILDKKMLTHNVFELHLEKPTDTVFEAGQYMSIVVPNAGPNGRNLRRAYSIASAPEEETLSLCIKIVEGGPGTNYLYSLEVGSLIEAQLPFGHFVLNHDLNLPTVFISTGTGVAPFRSMLLSKKWKKNPNSHFLFGVRHENDIFYKEFYPELNNGNTILPINPENIKICLSQASTNWHGFKGRVTEYLKQMDLDFQNTHFYLCGSGAMIADVKQYLMESKAVQKSQIHTEKYY
jgi:ferredoxin-NADP reductase